MTMRNRYDTITVTTDVEVSISDITDKYDWPEMMEAYEMSVDDVLDELDNDDVFAWLEKQDDIRGKLLAQAAWPSVEFTEHNTEHNIGLFTTARINNETRAVLVPTENGINVTIRTADGVQHFSTQTKAMFFAQRLVRGLLVLDSMESGS
jgi:hypothetical protein